MTNYVIGVDIGTGSTKALAINTQGKVIYATQVHYPTLTPAPGLFEQAPELVWQAFVKCISRITSEIKVNPDAIILSSAMHSIIPVDRKGMPLSNMIIWADSRSAQIAEKIKRSAAGEMIYEQTGTPIHAMSPLCKITWMKDNDEKKFQATAKFISIKEYIWFRLFSEYQVDHSIGSATGLMDIVKRQWNQNALNICSITSDHLSKLVSTNYSRNDADPLISTQMGVAAQTVFIMGASDGCLANLGSFATAPGIAALTIGTSGAVRVASTSPVYNFEAMTFNYLLDEQTFICGGPTNNGGVVLKWYAENFLQKPLNTINDYDAILTTLSATKPGSDGLIFLPYLFGERAPVWNSDASGIFFGIRSMHTQAHFTRAVIEGISMALYDIADSMMRSHLDITEINVSGGFVKSLAWLQILSNIFNKKMNLINSDDASALGAAYLGLKTLGIVNDYDALKPDTITQIFPQPEFLDVYRNNFLTYRNLYRNPGNE